MEQSAAYEGQQVYHPKGWWGHYVFSQDHKIIALVPGQIYLLSPHVGYIIGQRTLIFKEI